MMSEIPTAKLTRAFGDAILEGQPLACTSPSSASASPPVRSLFAKLLCLSPPRTACANKPSPTTQDAMPRVLQLASASNASVRATCSPRDQPAH
jgi:hypothetical protein